MLGADTNSAGLGAPVMAAAAILGTAISVYNYLTPLSGIDGTAGAILVIVSTLILFAFGLALSASRVRGALRTLIVIASALGIVGTAFAAYLLESQALLILMIICALGWLLYLFPRRKAA